MTDSQCVFLLRPGALGDTLLLAPALANLSASSPASRVALAGHEGATRLLAAAGLVGLPLSRDDPRLAALFGDGADLGSLAELLGPTAAAVAWLADPEGRVAANLRRLGAPLVAVVPSLPEAGSGRHVAAYLLDTLAGIGLARGGTLTPPPLLRAPAEELPWAEGFLAQAARPGLPLVAVHPGSGGRRKNWPAHAFAEVVEGLVSDCAVVLVGGPADTEAFAVVQSRARSGVLLARDLPLARVAAVLSRCAAYLGNDSGLTHLAALLGVPTVALFGPTDPTTWGPQGQRVTVLRFSPEAASLAPAAVVAAVRAQLGAG